MVDFPIRKWTMIVDMDKCTGCQACVVACHAENNVPIHTEKEIAKGRGMNWIYIQRYWESNYPDPRPYFMPNLCQQCGRAPCEPVCPVYATLHSERENLNLQVYNRCVGTRYCQNNDPYKVRFFNFFDPDWPAPLTEQLNPDVTVRTAGIMEKCTFCIQRVRRAEEEALVAGVNLMKAKPVPACVQTCPPSALIFGDFNDPEDPVHDFIKSKRAFRLLDSLGTESSIYYLKAGESNG